MNQKDLIIFDLDGVLWDSNEAHKASYELACARFSLKCPEYKFLAGLSTSAGMEFIAKYNSISITGLSEIFEAFIRFKREKSKEALTSMSNKELNVWESFELFQKVPIALVTGASESTVSIYLSKIQMNPFSLILKAEDYAPKPSTDGFLQAIKYFGVDNSRALIFEDSPAGIQSAQESEIDFVHIFQSWGKCNSDHARSNNVGCFRDIADWADSTNIDCL